MVLWIHFDICGSLRALFPGLFVYLGIDFEFGKELLDTTLVLDDHKASLEILSEDQIIVSV